MFVDNYFASIAETSIQQIYANYKKESFIAKHVINSLFFRDITLDEILSDMHQLKNTRCSGFDGITLKTIIYAADFIIFPLCHII